MALAITPAAAVVWLIARFGVQVPTEDAIDLVPLLAHAREGHPSMAELFAKHNGHIIFFPRLLQVPLVLATRWWMPADWALSWLVAVIGFVVVARRAAWAVPIAALLWFSFAPYEDWLSDWALPIFLLVTAAVGAFALLDAERPSIVRDALAWVLAAVALFSFAAGAVVWPIACAQAASRRRFRTAAAFLVGGVALLALFAPRLENRPLPWSLIVTLDFWKFVLAYVGAPMAALVPSPLACGVVGVGALTALVAIRRRDLASLRLPLAIAAFALGSAAATALGRLSLLGVAEAAHPRYLFIGQTFWLALLWLAADARPRVVPAVAAIWIVVIALAGDVAGWGGARNWNHGFSASRESLVAGREDVAWTWLYPDDPNVLRERAALLRAWRYSVFR
jgi:hypothetical protein